MKTNEQNNNYMRDKKNNARKYYETKEQSRKSAYERKIKNEQKYGKSENIMSIGESDRLGGNAPQILDDEQIQRSYSYGYFERGSRVLTGKFEQGIYSEEAQKKFGMSDFKYGVPEKFIKNLKEYPAYLEGRCYQMGINAYDFIIENGITIEEYISIMSITNPEINTKTFLTGYSDRLNEYKSKKSR